MGRKGWRDIITGMALPTCLSSDKWCKGGGDQEHAEDSIHNQWFRERNHQGKIVQKKGKIKYVKTYHPGYVAWTHIFSEYREGVVLTVTLHIDKNLFVEDITVDANYASCHGRPVDVGAQTREEYQVGRMLKKLFGV